MTITREALTTLARTLRIDAGSAGKPSVTARASLTPESLTIQDAISGLVEGVFLTKDVIFKTASLEPSLDAVALTSDADGAAAAAHRILRGLPIADVVQPLAGTVSGALNGVTNGTVTGTVSGVLSGTSLSGPLAGTVTGPVTGALTGTIAGQAGEALGTAANAPGLLGQLRASVPIGVTELPVAIAVTWSVLNGDVTPPAPLTAGTDFVAPEGLSAPVVTIAFMPPIVRMTTTPPLTVRRILRATVTLTAAGVTSDPVNIDTTVLVPALPVPTVLALFRHPHFSPTGRDPGAVMLITPPDSPLVSLEDFNAILGQLASTMASLSSLPATPLVHFAAFLTGLNVLRSALAGPQPVVVITASSSIPFLDVFRLDRGIFTLPIIDVDVLTLNCEDRFDSLIFLGKSGDGASLFNDRSFSTTGGQLDVTAGAEMFVLVRDLRSATPVAEPAAGVAVVTAPNGGWSPRTRDPFDLGHTVTTFAHEFSSVRLNLP